MYEVIFFFFNDPATTDIYTLSLHDALPIFDAGVPVAAQVAGAGQDEIAQAAQSRQRIAARPFRPGQPRDLRETARYQRSEEHTSELQSRQYLVCRLLFEKKKNTL